ncbi:MAG: DUF488 domain-containing protein [Burkholderiaceae bacterium]
MANKSSATPSLVCTIGHSTHSLEAFIGLLQTNGVAHVLDVRTVPRSRHNPQFNRDALPASLQTAGIGYTHLPGLGGLRHTRADSINTGWRNLSFRGYADYMQTAEFADQVQQLVVLAARERCALMCAEAVPWRCHRSLIADALLLRGVTVEDIIGPHGRKPHHLTPWAHAEGLHIWYPPVAVAVDTSPAQQD